jgi:hypothetical protein
MKKKNSKIWGSHRRKVMSKSVWEQGTEMIGGGGCEIMIVTQLSIP